MNKRTKRVTTVLAGTAIAGLAATGITAAAIVTPGAGGQPVNVCYSQTSSKTPNIFVQFRSENFGNCGAGYKHFTISQPQDAGINANGPYPGRDDPEHNLTGGPRQSTEKWAADEATAMHTSWVTCAPGQVATGGGFSTADESLDAKKGLQVLNSSPAQIDPATGKVQTIDGGYTPIAGDPNGAFKPNGWVVQGVNRNVWNALIVRPFVVCGKG